MDQLKVIDLNGPTGSVQEVLGIAFDPFSHAGGQIRLFLAYADDNTAPFNGKIARAVSTNGGVSYTVNEDFITGLPRSSYDHQTNGLAFGPDGCLYIAQGGNSNVGYHPNFAESRMSGAILRACFNLSDGTLDAAFDGNCGSGNTQEACSVKVYASRLRVIVMPSFSSVGGFTDGLIASCTFQISSSATTGTHTLNAERQEAGNSAGGTIGSVADNGSITVQ